MFSCYKKTMGWQSNLRSQQICCIERESFFFKLLKKVWNYAVIASLLLVSMNKKGLLRKKTAACLQRQDKRTKGWEDHGEVKKNEI